MKFFSAKKFTPIKSGFTIIELLIVMAMLGVLGISVILVLNPLQQLAKARDAERKSDFNSIRHALELYYNDHNQYPDHCGGGATGVALSSSAQPWIPELAPYLKTIPVDPINKYSQGQRTTLVYQYQSKNIGTVTNKNPNYGSTASCDAQHFVLGAQLEVSSDPNINWDFSDYFDGWYVNYILNN